MKQLLLTVALASAVACGVKTAPRPPEDTAARAPRAVRATITADGRVRIEWKRPEHSVDGQRLDDLVRFLVERSIAEGAFETVATVEVLDRTKLRPRSSYHYVDSPPSLDKLRYRVRGVAADGQEGVPCEPVSPQAAAAGAQKSSGR